MIFIWLFVILKFHFCWIMTCICLDARTFLNDINSRVLLIGFKYDNSNFYSAGHIESHLSTFIDDQSTDSVIQVEKNFVWGDQNGRTFLELQPSNHRKMPNSTNYGYGWYSEEQLDNYYNKLIGKTPEIFKVLLNILSTFSFRRARRDFEEAVLHRREEDELPGGDQVRRQLGLER